MQDVTVYQVGGRLWSLRKLLREHQALIQIAKAYQKLDMLMSTVSLEHSPDREKTASPDEDSVFIARILIGILQRGHASIVSPFVESCIVRGGWADVLLADMPELEPALPISMDQAETFGREVIASLIGGDRRTSPDWTWSFDSQSERRFFEHHLSRLLGPGVALVEAQRPLPSMVLEQDAHRFHSQRVDFALETPDGLKIVFEIDGPVHRDPGGSQVPLDRERTIALRRAKWIVERIPSNQVWREDEVFSDVVRAQVADNATLQALRDGPQGGQATGVDASLAYRCAIGPHAVARIQLAVLLAMLRGELSLQDPEWRIGVIERDLLSAEVAVVDLLDQMTQLCALYGVDARPKIRLVIVPAYTSNPQGTSRRLSWTPIDIHYTDPHQLFEEINSLDLLIDVSVRTRPRDIRPDDPLPPHHLRGMVTLYELRTAYRRLPEAFIEWPAPRPVPDPDAIEQPLRYFLQTLFRRPDFREKQLDVMKRAMARKDVLGLLPTGGGKSLTFQLPTLLSPGVTLVIAPLKSLIDDQVDNLHRAGINRVAGIHSGHVKERKEKAIQEIVSGYPRFVYVSPERLHVKRFRDDLRSSPIATSLAFSVVDEAHCVSEWGHDFRPAYLSVAHQARALFVTDAGPPPIIALTATASNNVLVDILRELAFDEEDPDTQVSVTSFDRRELRFLPVTGTPATKRKDLDTVLHQVAHLLGCNAQTLFDDPERAGIVFCRYVNGEYGVTGVSNHLQGKCQDGARKVKIYAGSQPKKWSGEIPWEDHKRRVQRAFKDSTFPTLVATSSFGMGIDKENIRYTIHYGIPHSLEALAQEAGRAGRDRSQAACAIVYTAESLQGDADYLAPNLSTDDARQRADAVPRKEQGDTSRIMYLHGLSYPGVDAEYKVLNKVFDAIRATWSAANDTQGPSIVVLTRPPGESESKEFDKALYRLTALGAIHDYTINYAARQVEVETQPVTPQEMERRFRAFVRRYGVEQSAEDALATANQATSPANPHALYLRAICIFSYRVIEASRREALRNVVEALRACQDDGEALAQKLNAFLSNNTFTGRVSDLVRRDDEREWFTILEEVHNPDLARQLGNAVGRELESSATHPGLHLLSGLANIRFETFPTRPGAERILASLNYYTTTFGKTALERRELAGKVIGYIRDNRGDRLDDIVSTLLRLSDDDDIARAAYPHVVDPTLRRRCVMPWLRDARDTARSLRRELVESAS